MIEAGAIGLIMRVLESQGDNIRLSAMDALRRMAKYGAISRPCVIIELTDFTETLCATMIEPNAIKLIAKMLEIQDDYVRLSAVGAVGNMAEHGAINHDPRMIIELTDSTKRNSGPP